MLCSEKLCSLSFESHNRWMRLHDTETSHFSPYLGLWYEMSQQNAGITSILALNAVMKL